MTIQHIRLRGPRRTGHFSSSGFYYKGHPGPEDPRSKTHCGQPPTAVDVGWRSRGREDTPEWVICPDCREAAKS